MTTQQFKNSLLLAFLILSACSAPKEKSEPKDEEVTYQQVALDVYGDVGERIEWHGEAIDISAKSSIELFLNGPCEKKDCGEKYFIKNNDSTRMVEIVVNSKFLIEDQEDMGHVRKYTLSPKSEQYVGCSKFCHELESFEILNEVVGAKFL